MQYLLCLIWHKNATNQVWLKILLFPTSPPLRCAQHFSLRLEWNFAVIAAFCGNAKFHIEPQCGSIAIRSSDSNIRNIVAALAAASCCSLFLHFSGKPASATGSGLPLHHRAVIHYRSLGCGFALPTPYTGQANAPTDFICIISVIQYCFVCPDTTLPCLPTARVQFCGFAKQNFIFNFAAIKWGSQTRLPILYSLSS